MKKKSFSVAVIFSGCAIAGLFFIFSPHFRFRYSQFSTRSLSISFYWSNHHAATIEESITSRVEAAIGRIEGIEKIESTSKAGGGEVRVHIASDADPRKVQFSVSSLLKSLWYSFPTSVSAPIIKRHDNGMNERQPLLQLALIGSAGQESIAKVALEHIKPEIMKIVGVDDVEVVGILDKEISIHINQHGLDVQRTEIYEAIQRHLSDESVGLLQYEFNGDTLTMRGRIPSTVNNTEKIEGIAIIKVGNKVIRLSDLGSVKFEMPPETGFYRVNGESTVSFNVFPAENVKPLEIAGRIMNYVSQREKNLPEGLRFIVTKDNTKTIKGERNHIIMPAIASIILVTLVAFLATRRKEISIVVFIFICMNIAIVPILYYWFNVNISSQVLLAAIVSFALCMPAISFILDRLLHPAKKLVERTLIAWSLILIISLIAFFQINPVNTLHDFALALIVNQLTFSVTALLLLPALFNLICSFPNTPSINGAGDGISALLQKLSGYKRITITIAVLAFGLPLFLLPLKLEESGWLAGVYNRTFGNHHYLNNIRPYVDKLTGGSIRLFIKNVYREEKFDSPAESFLVVSTSLAPEAAVEHVSQAVEPVEAYLKKVPFVDHFLSQSFPGQSLLFVHLQDHPQQADLANSLKREIVSFTQALGGEWTVFGVGDAFSNKTMESAGSYNLSIRGFNYNDLHAHAKRLTKELERNQRVQQVSISPEVQFFRREENEFSIRLNHAFIKSSRISPSSIYASLANSGASGTLVGYAVTDDERKKIGVRLYDNNADFSAWSLMNEPLQTEKFTFKLQSHASIDRLPAPALIRKENQEYKLYVQFNYLGSDKFARQYIERIVDTFSKELPIGYKLNFSNESPWHTERRQVSHEWLSVVLTLVIIYLVSAIFLESLKLPFAIMFTVPIAFVGVFLSFYFFQLPFNYDTVSVFILVSLFAVGCSLFVLSDFNTRRKSVERGLYIRSLSINLKPLCMAIASVVAGCLPFLFFNSQKMLVTLAVGTIAGTLFTAIAIAFYLPLFLKTERT